MRHVLFAYMTALGCVLVASGAVAEEPDVGGEDALVDAEDVDEEDLDDHQKMLEWSARGNDHYAQGDIEKADEAYERAFEAYPQPILLKNQMITRYLLDDCETSIDLGEAFLDTGSYEESDLGDVNRVLGDCSLKLAEASLKEGEVSQAEQWLEWGEDYRQSDAHKERAESVEGRIKAEAALERRRAREQEQEEEELVEAHGVDASAGGTSMAAWGLIGGGVAAVVGGGLWHLRWESQVSDLESIEDPAAFEEEQQRLNDRRGTTRLGVTSLYALGLGAIAAGSMWMIRSRDEGGEASRAQWSPVYNGDKWGATVRLNF